MSKLHINGSARSKGRDYSAPGLYYITMVTEGRVSIFGDVNEGVMILSPIGEIVKAEWEKSFQIRKELSCMEYIIMPNHIHAVVCIDAEGKGLIAVNNPVAEIGKNNAVAYRTPKSISSFVAGFKSAATKRINEFRHTPGNQVWQDKFWDRIVRKNEVERIIRYIRDNPMKYCAQDEDD